MVTTSSSIINLAKALSAFQGQLKPVVKDETNPFYKSRYASLDAIWNDIRKPLADNGLALTQFPTGDNELTSLLLHVSGEFITATYKMTPKDDTPQGRGSTITYMRRYAMSAILGIVTEEDDDAEKATHPIQPAAQNSNIKKICVSCNQEFAPKVGTEKWAKQCLTCFKTKRPIPDQTLPTIQTEISVNDSPLPPF